MVSSLLLFYLLHLAICSLGNVHFSGVPIKDFQTNRVFGVLRAMGAFGISGVLSGGSEGVHYCNTLY